MDFKIKILFRSNSISTALNKISFLLVISYWILLIIPPVSKVYAFTFLYIANPFLHYSHNLLDTINSGVASVNYLVLNDEKYLSNEDQCYDSFRLSRLTHFDYLCDYWYESLIGNITGLLGEVSQHAYQRIRTRVPLIRPLKLLPNNPLYTPYQQHILPSMPLLPSCGLEQYGLPTPRIKTEAWNGFNLRKLISFNYSLSVPFLGFDLVVKKTVRSKYQQVLQQHGLWLDDCQARLVYVNGRYVPSLSKSTENTKNLHSLKSVNNTVIQYMKRFTDGFTDIFVEPESITNKNTSESMKIKHYSTLSLPNHNVGSPTSQFAINSQHGMAAFSALNSHKMGCVAFVTATSNGEKNSVLIVNVWTNDGGIDSLQDIHTGISFHPRIFVLAKEHSQLNLLQSFINLNDNTRLVPKFTNSYTQLFVEAHANVTHSYRQESSFPVKNPTPNIHFETVDVHLMGTHASHKSTFLSFNPLTTQSRIAFTSTLLHPHTHTSIDTLSLTKHQQQSSFHSLIHHIGPSTTSSQRQRNIVTDYSQTMFKGKMRVEQSGQKSNSQQCVKSIILSNSAIIHSMPSLEIIADDVKCTHGSTVSNINKEEIFYFQSRGVDPSLANEVMLFSFGQDMVSTVNKSWRNDSSLIRIIKEQIEEINIK